jgi:hypothetical protein
MEMEKVKHGLERNLGKLRIDILRGRRLNMKHVSAEMAPFTQLVGADLRLHR